jgi:hypothetical protein
VLDIEGLKWLDLKALENLVDYCPNIRRFELFYYIVKFNISIFFSSLNLFGIINLDADGLFTVNYFSSKKKTKEFY